MAYPDRKRYQVRFQQIFKTSSFYGFFSKKTILGSPRIPPLIGHFNWILVSRNYRLSERLSMRTVLSPSIDANQRATSLGPNLPHYALSSSTHYAFWKQS